MDLKLMLEEKILFMKFHCLRGVDIERLYFLLLLEEPVCVTFCRGSFSFLSLLLFGFVNSRLQICNGQIGDKRSDMPQNFV